MTEQKPEKTDNIKNALLRVWQTLVTAVTQAGHYVVVTAQRARENLVLVWHERRKKRTPASHQSGNIIQIGYKKVAVFFTRMMRQARYDIKQLWLKTSRGSSNRNRAAQKTTKEDTKAESIHGNEDDVTADIEQSVHIGVNDIAAENQQTSRYQAVKSSDDEPALQQTTGDPPRSGLIGEEEPDRNQLAAVLPKKKKTPPIRRRSRQRVYRLKGYTTVAKVNRKHQAEMQQQFLRKLLLYVGIILLVIILFRIYNPFRDLSEWYRIIGVSDLSDLTQDSPLFPDVTPIPTD